MLGYMHDVWSKFPALVQVRRERRLESNLAKLRKLCIEVGADDAEVAASVHHTLRNYHETMRGQYYTYSKPLPDPSIAPETLATVRTPRLVPPSHLRMMHRCHLAHVRRWAHTLGVRTPCKVGSRAKHICMQVALTDSVFASLDARMEEMAAVKEEREATLGELREVLHSMWDSVGITDEDENRKFFERMLSSPARLHTHTHEKVPSCAPQATGIILCAR